MSNHLKRVALLLLILSGFATAQPAIAEDEPLDVAGKIFMSSGKWYQFERDIPERIFRLYAAVLDENSKLVDFPNLLLLKCNPTPPYLTIHFPDYFRFTSFAKEDWFPETTVYARNEHETFKFTGELNGNEIYLDLTDENKHLNDLLTSPSMEICFGKEAADRIVLMIPPDLYEIERKTLEENLRDHKNGPITRVFDSWSSIADCSMK